MAEQVLGRSHPGLILGVARFYHDPRGSMRGVLDSHPSEARLLAYAMIAAAFLLAGRIAGLLTSSTGDVMARVLEQTVSLLFFLPLAYFGLAALGTWLARLAGGQGGWADGRAAFFWAALVSAPLILASALGQIAMAGAGPTVKAVIGQIGAVFFAWALANCFAETFGFASVWKVLAVIVGTVGALTLLIWLALQ